MDETQEPTLRRGDSAPDGWVEYLQQLLNSAQAHHGAGELAEDGNFGPATERAVYAFQAAVGLMTDGIVGNQTWASLRGEAPQAPGTDGRAPHTYQEAGIEARWFSDTSNDVRYDRDADLLFIWAVNTGTETIDRNSFKYVGVVTTAELGSNDLVMDRLADESGAENPIQPGQAFVLLSGDVTRRYGRGQAYVEATMDASLGGDALWAELQLADAPPDHDHRIDL